MGGCTSISLKVQQVVLNKNRSTLIEVLSYSTFRQSLASVLDKVNENSTPIQITRKGNKGAIVMSVDDYEQLEKTLYVLQNKSLSAQIEKAIETHEAGKGRKADKQVMDEIINGYQFSDRLLGHWCLKATYEESRKS